MTTEQLIALEDDSVLKTYRKWPIVLERGEGRTVWDTEGRSYLDFYGGHCVTILGHSHPAVTAAISAQAERLLFYSNVCYSRTRAEAAATLIELAPDGFTDAFFINSGSEANETAMKIARKSTGRPVVVALKDDFHGRTLGSLATSWKDTYRAPYQNVLSPTVFVPHGDVYQLASVLSGHDVAAVIFEPIQSMAGMQMPTKEYFAEMASLCREHGTLLIADEIQTGVGRTGTFSYMDGLGILPDMICLAKSLANGVPAAATLVTEAVAGTVDFGDQGTTFGGGMLAMAAMQATLEALRDDGLMERAGPIYDRISAECERHGLKVRGAGCLIGIDLGAPVAPVLSHLRANGVLAGGSLDANVMRVMPPLTTTDAEVDHFLEAFKQALSEQPAAAGGVSA